jgi:hypothetical protein
MQSERTVTHDMLQNLVTAIALKSGVHVQREVSDLFPCHTWRRVDIVITKNNFQTLVNIVIVDATHIDLV